MEDKFGDLIIRDYIFDGIGPAMNSGRAIFFYGPPGNGKTAICQGMVNCYEGDIFIPHALLVDDFIVRIFDHNIHKARPRRGEHPALRPRWVRCRRPLVVVGGELTLEMLDLIYSPEVKYYEAPFQMKATNGMLLIDDFGRQKVLPKDLLNRWIVPLESDVDYPHAAHGQEDPGALRRASPPSPPTWIRRISWTTPSCAASATSWRSSARTRSSSTRSSR